MKHITTAAFMVAWACFSLLAAQNVSTLTTSAAPIDDDIIFDQKGNLYGSNYGGSAVFKRTPAGVESKFTDGLDSPNGLAFQTDGTLIVADNTGNKIYKVFPDGSKQVWVSSLLGPSGLIRAFDSDTILVTTYPSQDIWKLAPDGSLRLFLRDPQLKGPVGMCYDEQNNLYIANFTDRKIFKYGPDRQLRFLTQPPLGQNIGFITYAKGFIYATAMNAHRIYKIDLDGNYTVWLGSTPGSTNGGPNVAKFNQPNGIRASFTGDTLYISEFGGKRVRMVTNLNGTTPDQEALMPDWNLSVSNNPMAQMAAVRFELPASTTLSLGLYDAQGRLVQALLTETRLAVGQHRYELPYNGLTKGIYFLHLQATDGRLVVKKILM